MLTFNFKKYDLNKEGSMLDVGCGEGRHIFGVMQEFPMMKCIGLDMDNDSLQKAEEGYAYFESISDAGAEFMKGSAYSLPFSDNTFDLIVCSEVLEHLHEYNDAVIEINRVLKPGGKFYASVPASWPEKICWYLSKDYQNQPGGHLRIFNQRELINEIEECGFKFLSSEKFHSIACYPDNEISLRKIVEKIPYGEPMFDQLERQMSAWTSASGLQVQLLKPWLRMNRFLFLKCMARAILDIRSRHYW